MAKAATAHDVTIFEAKPEVKPEVELISFLPYKIRVDS
jgi:hypothetical protein